MSKSSEAVKRWRKRSKELIVKSMGGCCQICNYAKTNSALELHHIDPSQKEMSFGGIRANPIAIHKIGNELKKCILLCSNCHKEVHEGIAVLPLIYTKFDEFFSEIAIEEVTERKVIHNKKISISVARQRKILLTNAELHAMVEVHKGNVSSCARELDVSETAIRKRLKKYEMVLAKE
jgi:hypothetical protein